jgi:Flp pilus assembly pilin Flp
MRRWIERFAAEESGSTAIEYVAAVGIVGIALVVGLEWAGGWIGDMVGLSHARIDQAVTKSGLGALAPSAGQ